ncbi:hypothetical protein ABK040_006092 [Willaertia magna]
MNDSKSNNVGGGNKAFEVDDYEVQFDALLNVKEAREFFFLYLAPHKVEEIVEFIDAYEELKAFLTSNKNKDINNIIEKVQSIINTFVVGESHLALNISGSVKQGLLKQWQELSQELTRNSDKALEMDIVTIKINYLFEDLEFAIHRDLKTGYFSKFVRSKEFKDFLKQKGELFTRKIALKKNEIDIRYQPKDFIEPTLTDKDIYFGFSLAEDSNDWNFVSDGIINGKNLKSIKENNINEENYKWIGKYQVFVSKTNYVIGDNLKGMRVAKVILDLPCDMHDAVASIFDQDGRMAGDEQLMGDFITYRHTKVNPTNNIPLSYTHTSQGLKPALFTSVRDFVCLQTSIYDQKLDCIINIGKSAKFESDIELMFKDKRIPVDLLYYNMFYNSGNGRCKYVHIYYVDLKFKFTMNNIHVFNMIAKTRAKALLKLKLKDILKKTNFGTQPYEIKNEVFNYKQCLNENTEQYPHRSWYNEWENLNNNNQQHL